MSVRASFSPAWLLAAATLTAAPAAGAPTETVVYSFKDSQSGDGAYPAAALLNGGKALYGTTYYGGADLNGTIFKLDLSGGEKTLHSFAADSSDGLNPSSALTALNGGLYGVTQGGGATGDARQCGCGTIYRATEAGQETVIHAFGNTGDGAFPAGGLLKLGGALYSTTTEGGATNCNGYGCGTLFKIAPDGTESVFYAFKGDATDGASPGGTLIVQGGNIIGVARGGGVSGNGSVFSITPAGILSVLYSFQGGTDGAGPAGGVIESGGAFYGTTFGGGKYGGGTVYRLTATGTETILHSFGAAGDGSNPSARLTRLGGKFYGTTADGGRSNNGTVFEITPSGKERTIHAFGGETAGDGSGPYGDLIAVNGLLYGTTAAGGKSNTGIVFTVMP